MSGLQNPAEGFSAATDVRHAIWWTSEQDCKWLGENPEWPESVPVYVREQYKNRWGRQGRGRLWCADNMPKCVNDWPESQISRAAYECGGIVLLAEHAASVAVLPGFLTDMDLCWLLPPPNVNSTPNDI